jgi:hypothetical protein
LGCGDDAGPSAALHVGEQTAKSNLQQLSPDQLFLSFDTGSLPAGCSLQASIDNGRAGKSQPFTLAHIIRMPQLDAFALKDGQLQDGTRSYLLTGENLEMIQKLGWNGDDGVDELALPTPIPGQGQRQSLEIRLPDPPKGQCFLYVWLRGDTQGRLTTVKAPPLPATPAASSPSNAGAPGPKAQPPKPAPSEAGKTPAGPSPAAAGTPPGNVL